MTSRTTDPSWSRVALAVAATLAMPTGVVVAQEAPAADDELEQVIITGTRRADRTVLESTAPIDVVSNQDLQSVFSPDLNFKLQALVPSYNVRRAPTADGNIFVRPATLRNLSPDHTLVLVNGKRFHRTAFVEVTSRGAQAVDLSLIPSSAFKRTEVLRDGAAAQYGSDAIAGVINLVLDDQSGSDAYVQYGQFESGGGENLQVGASTGFKFGTGGHLNLAGEYIDGKASNNGRQLYSADLIAAQGATYAAAIDEITKNGSVQRYGQPDLEQYKFFVNTGYTFDNGVTVYGFGNYSDQSGVGDFNYRPSVTTTGTGADGATTTFARNGGYNIRNSNGYASSAYNDTWRLIDVYPGGFTPRFGSDTSDYSLYAGVKGKVGDKFDWDFSGSLGSNYINYWMKETINLSFGPDSPLDFPNLGGREQREQNANLDFVYQWDTGLAEAVNVAFGAEYRREQFRIRPGSYESWATGPLVDLSAAANGFPGAHPLSAGTWASHNTAAYVDFDIPVSERFDVDIAGRVEDFSLFGTTTNGKLAARFEVSDRVALRGAVSTGFRAPTPGQQYLQNVSQNPNLNTAIARSVDIRAQLPSNSAAAALFGGEALKPEESVNLSLGLVLQPVDGLAVTVDVYRIDVDDRIGLSQTFELTDAQRAQLVAANVPLAAELTHVSFYTNAFDTRTQGVDVVGTWRGTAGPGRLTLTSATNFNKTKFTDYVPALFSDATRRNFVEQNPKFKTQLSADYAVGKLGVTGRIRNFGKFTQAWSTTGAGDFQVLGSETFFDLIGTWRFSSNVDVTVGIENLFDNYTDKATNLAAQNLGRIYPPGTPYENGGRQFYGRLGVRF